MMMASGKLSGVVSLTHHAQFESQGSGLIKPLNKVITLNSGLHAKTNRNKKPLLRSR